MVETAAASQFAPSHVGPILWLNPDGASPFVLVCDHASNRIPAEYDGLGLPPIDLVRHIAWDPGALAVARRLSEALDATLVASTVSRLVIDCNRELDAPDLIPLRSELTDIPGNVELGADARADRVARIHRPFHDAVAGVLERRLAEARETVLVTVHSFTPVYADVPRPWPIGLIPGADPAFSLALKAALLADDPDLNLGWNQPYSALKGVTYTLEHHGDARGVPCTMIELRHDEILDPRGVARWSEALAGGLETARHALQLHSQQGQAGTVSQPGGING